MAVDNSLHLRSDRLGISDYCPPQQERTIGRKGDILIGVSHKATHEVCVTLYFADIWFVKRREFTPHIRVTVVDASGTRTELAEDGLYALTATTGSIIIQCRQRSYQIDWKLTAAPRPTSSATRKGSTLVEDNKWLYSMPDEHRRVLVALCRSAIEKGGHPPLPSNRSIYKDLHWTKKKFDGILDTICANVAELTGLEGLVGNEDSRASNRRNVLVDWAVTNRVVSIKDVIRLEGEFNLYRG